MSSRPSSPLPLLYRQTAADDSLLLRDSLMFCRTTQPEGEAWGMKGYAMPDTPHRSDIIAVSFLICFLLLLVIRTSYRDSLRNTLSNFFFPSNSVHEKTEDNRSEGKRIIIALLFCLQGAIALLTVTQMLDITPQTLSPWLMAGIYALILFLFLVVKQFLYLFTHYVFFTPAQQHRWREDYAFLFAAESLLFFPLLLVFVYLQLDFKIVAILALAVLLFVKILLLFKCFSAFFEKCYGILHLFVYFCTLEAAPLVLLWTILVELTQGLYLI